MGEAAGAALNPVAASRWFRPAPQAPASCFLLLLKSIALNSAVGGLEGLPTYATRLNRSNLNPAVGIDADEMLSKAAWWIFDRAMPLAEQLVGIGHDLGRTEQVIVGQIADRAQVIVGREHAVAEGRLVQPLLNQAQSIASLGRVRRSRRGSGACHFSEGRRARRRRASQSAMKVGMIA